jgi:hypothetical protein
VTAPQPASGEFDRLSTRHQGLPEEHAPEPNQRPFVIGALVACLLTLAAVFALNVVVDPFALAGTHLVPAAVEQDRQVKLTLLEHYPSPGPETLIFGSSRARTAEPAFLEKLTGHTGFNGGVTGGDAADAYVFTRYAAELFPETKHRYIWFVDVGVGTNAVNPQLQTDPRARRYLKGTSLPLGLRDVGTYLSTQATRASVRVLRDCVLNTCTARIRYLRDGSIPHQLLFTLPEHSKNVRAEADQMVARILANPPVSPRVATDPRRYVWFERTLAFMNARGEQPVIVLNPVYPSVLAALERYGYPARSDTLAYIRALHLRFHFVFVDAQDIRTWHGDVTDFENATHVNSRNMRRLLQYVVLHSDGALR